MDDVRTRNARAALEQLLALRAGENFLIVTDTATESVAQAFLEAACQIGAQVSSFHIDEASRPLREIPEALMERIPDTDVAVTCFSSLLAETPFRVELIGTLSRVVRRLGHAPGITIAMLTEGPMAVDYEAMALEAHALIRRLDGAQRVRVTAPGGTRIDMTIAGRPFTTDTVVPDGCWGNLPAGEIWCAPVEDSAQGVVVCDGSIGDLGQVPAPVRLTVTNGRVTDVSCADAGFARLVSEALQADEGAGRIGELGLGLNPGARLSGNLLEDEKAHGTAHIAFGNNLAMGGGRNASKTHRDFLFLEPTFEVAFADGRTKRPIVAGRITTDPAPSSAVPRHAYRHVLAAIDFSDVAESVLDAAHGIAVRNGARLSVCHVVARAPAVSPLFPQDVAMPDTARHLEEAAFEQLDDRVREATGRGPADYMALVATGDPVAEILALATRNDVDLIVTANRSTGVIAGMVLGTVAQGVAREADCHVLLVRPNRAVESKS